MRKKVALAVFLIITIIIIYKLTSQIIYALKSGQRLSLAADALIKLQNTNKDLKKKLEEAKSSDFIEAEARNKLGLAKPGETIVVIPQEKINGILGASASAQKAKLPNWLGWWRVFF